MVLSTVRNMRGVRKNPLYDPKRLYSHTRHQRGLPRSMERTQRINILLYFREAFRALHCGDTIRPHLPLPCPKSNTNHEEGDSARQVGKRFVGNVRENVWVHTNNQVTLNTPDGGRFQLNKQVDIWPADAGHCASLQTCSRGDLQQEKPSGG